MPSCTGCTVLGAEGAVVRLTGAESVPEVEEHHGETPRSIALDAQGGVLPVAEALLRVDILVGQVHAAGVGDAPVDDHDLAVVAVVHHQREHRHHRVEGMHRMCARSMRTTKSVGRPSRLPKSS